ncbi:MAG: trypsin-like serine protease [Ruminococcaceae bacterium]|nr:trypsin-like serine protease [Oscillospiraceae bacterium]
MSDFNNYNNQTPPENNNRPDYSYNWNGSEHNGNNNKNKGAVIAIVLGVVAVIAVVAALVLFFTANDSLINVSDRSDISSSLAGLKDKSSAMDESSSRADYVVPEFTPSGDSDVDLSNVYTQIYDNCAPSCCTVSVSINGKKYSSGSGFVIDAENGYIATNHHVIEKSTEIEVIFYDGTKYAATLIGSDSTTDLAVLKIEAEKLVQVEFGDSNNIKVGEGVVAIGTPYDQSLAGTMTTGIISGVARGVEITNNSGKVIKVMTLLQTDCSINPGNSGGPLIDMAGNVVGITSLKLVDERFEGIGFAIPITDALDIFKKLIAGEDIDGSGIATAAPRIGVTVYAAEYGFSYFRITPRCEYPKGLLVGDIEVTSSAYQAGLYRFDIITDFAGYPIETINDLNAAMERFKAGDEVEITVFRFDRYFQTGKSETIRFKLDAAE